MESPCLRIAHRGASGTAPELTRAAIAKALDIGVDMIEVDVQVTRDGHLVIFHDETLERTTSGSGAVREKTWDEISHLDAGAWFGAAFAGESLLDLDALLTLVGSRARLNLEIKSPPADWPILVPSLLRALDRAERLETSIVSCFDMDALALVRAASRTAPIGVLWYLPDLAAAWRAVEALGAVSLHPYVGIAQPELFAEACRRGIDSCVWTVNDTETMQRLITWGASGIMTDHPELFAEIASAGAGTR